jgi:hypothetical protein
MFLVAFDTASLFCGLLLGLVLHDFRDEQKEFFSLLKVSDINTITKYSKQ